jgi:hypothetical protein
METETLTREQLINRYANMIDAFRQFKDWTNTSIMINNAIIDDVIHDVFQRYLKIQSL